MIELDDFERDFDGAIQAMIEEAEREIAAIPEAEREAYFLAEAAKRLARGIEMRMPDCVVEIFEKSLSRRLRQQAKARRNGHPE